MSSWSQSLRRHAGTLRWLAGRLEAGPLQPAYRQLDEVWVGPAATDLAVEGAALDRCCDGVGSDLRRVATDLDRRAATIEAVEQAAAGAVVQPIAADAPADIGVDSTTSSPPPNWR